MRDLNSQVARFRLERGDTGELQLVHKERPDFTLQLRPQGLFLHIAARPRVVGRTLSEPTFGVGRWIVLSLSELQIGHRGDEGWRSTLRDDSIFVEDGDQLRPVQITDIRLLSLPEFEEEEQRIREMKEVTATLSGDALFSGDSPERAAFGRGRLNHVAAQGRDWPETVELSLAIPEPQFTELLEALLSRRYEQIYIHGVAFARSTAREFETGRDLVLASGEGVEITIDEANLAASWAHRADPAEGDVEEGPEGSEASRIGGLNARELLLRSALSESASAGKRATRLLVYTVAACAVVALADAGALLILVLAILGVGYAVVTALRAVQQSFLTVVGMDRFSGAPEDG